MTQLPNILGFLDSFLLPPSGSSSAANHDPVWNAVLIITTIFFFIVTTIMFVFIFKYRRRPGLVQGSQVTHNTPLEIVWTLIPLIIVMALFGVGLKGYMWYDKPPSDSYTIVAKVVSWKFTFYYPNGGISPYLYVPLGSDAHPRNIRLQIEAEPGDVLHAMYIPAYRIQRGAVPGRITELWFNATSVPPLHPGSSADTPENHFFDIFCTQYCGEGHSQMRSRVYVIADEAQFQAKLKQIANPFVDIDGNPLPLATVGKNLVDIYGCNSCHTIDGKPNTGPTWENLYKRDHTFDISNEAGYSLKATDSDAKWDAYLSESIIDPGAKIVGGFKNAMTNFAGQLSGPDPNDPKNENNRRRLAIIEYIKSLDHTKGPDGKPLYYKPAPIPTTAPAATESSTTQSGKQ